MKKSTPFFARFLENQNLSQEAESYIQGGRPSVTLKYPSDNEESVTTKWPSANDEATPDKWPSDNDEGETS